MKLLDKIHLQKYIYLIDIFLSNKVKDSTFVALFLQIRRDDPYWMTSSFDIEVNRIMDSMFLDIDEFNPIDFYEPTDKFNIDENELRIRLEHKLSLLNGLM